MQPETPETPETYAPTRGEQILDAVGMGLFLAACYVGYVLAVGFEGGALW